MNIVQKENESGSYHLQISFYCHAIGQKAHSLQDWTPWLTAEPAGLPQYRIT